MDARARRFAGERRSATLATLAPDGRPRLVPVCFVLAVRDEALRLYSALDEKPKRSSDVRRLARVRDILARPRVALLFDRWSEDWAHLGWVRAHGTASLLGPEAAPLEHAVAVGLLRDKYPQYRDQRIDRLPLVAVTIEGASAWGNLDADA
jgi:PPOX class probable F420-dependent enzyme